MGMGGGIPSVSGLGMGGMDTAAGLAALSLQDSALDKRPAAQTRA